MLLLLHKQHILFGCTVRICSKCVFKCRLFYNLLASLFIYVYFCVILQCVAPSLGHLSRHFWSGRWATIWLHLQGTNLGSLTMVITHFRCGPTLAHVFASDTIAPASRRPYPYEWLTVESKREEGKCYPEAPLSQLCAFQPLCPVKSGLQ